MPLYASPEIATEVLGNMYDHRHYCRETGRARLEQHLTGGLFSIDSHPVRFRLLTNEDMALWIDFVNGCSSRSLWLRFLSPFSATPERARRFCDINPEEEVAVVAEITEHDRKKLIAVARLIKCRYHDEAEYAVIVADPWQRKKLGRILCETCVNLARHLNVQVVSAEMIQGNFPIMRILNRFRFTLDRKDENMVFMSLKLL